MCENLFPSGGCIAGRIFFEPVTRLLVYQGKALNVPTVPYFIWISFGGKILKTCTFRTISKCKVLSCSKLIQPISKLNSIWNDYVVRDNSPRMNNSRYALSIMNKLFKARII